MQVEIYWDGKGHQRICGNAPEIKIRAVLNYVAKLGCSLDTLRLAFSFRAAEEFGFAHNPDGFYESSPSMDIPFSMNIMDAVAAMEVKEEIEIVVRSDKEWDCCWFNDFVDQVGFQKQWAVTVDRENPGSMSNDEDGEADFDGEDSQQGEGSSQEEVYPTESHDGQNEPIATTDNHQSAEDSMDGYRDEDDMSDDDMYSGCSNNGEYGIVRHITTWTIKPPTPTNKDKIPQTGHWLIDTT